MQTTTQSWRAVCLTLGVGAFMTLGQPAWAEKPDWVQNGNGKGKHEQRDDHRDKRERHDREDRHDRDDRAYRDGSDRSGVSVGVSVQLAPGVGVYFGTGQRTVVNDYYRPQFAAGKCPPGLAKKNNGCLPPGQAKKWAVGQRLPAGVERYPLPADLRVRLGPPPAGHEFVRVAGDILLIAVGTSMVIDALEDLSR
ncbi:MAG TPA: hypothetical protein VFY31_09665 [Macromonas sp.]|nr:hypothetical protein [Macromonas sp.]